MHELGAIEAKNRLGTLLDWVAQGEEVLITHHGRAAAWLARTCAEWAGFTIAVSRMRAERSGSAAWGQLLHSAPTRAR